MCQQCADDERRIRAILGPDYDWVPDLAILHRYNSSGSITDQQVADWVIEDQEKIRVAYKIA